MEFWIWGRPHWIRDRKLNTLDYFLFFWLLVCNFTLRWLLDFGSTSLEQNLMLKTLDYLLFNPIIFHLFFSCPIASFWLLLRKQSHLTDDNHSIWSFNFWSKGDSEGLGATPNAVSSGLWSQWQNPLQTAENDLQTYTQFFQNVEIPRIPKALWWHCGGL